MTLAALLEMAPANLVTVDIARMNLLCAQGLSGADCVDLDAAGTQLDAWAERVRSETARHRYRFNRNPAEFEGSEGFFKLLMLGVVLAEDYEVHYDLELRAGLHRLGFGGKKGSTDPENIGTYGVRALSQSYNSRRTLTQLTS